MIERKIPNTDEFLPVIGLGTWQTFDVGASQRERAPLIEVLRRFAGEGGKVIDSSPMYGRSEEVVGDLRTEVTGAFLATKVWTRGRENGLEQMERSMRLLKADTIDLMQIHNLVDWQTHLRTLRRWKDEGRIRYLGVTHYQTGAFRQLESIMREERLDFVQLPYSVTVPAAEERLLPLAMDRGIGVLVNRPFEEGTIFRNVRKQPLPTWVAELGCESWSEVFLRYIVSHPAVTCVIPATRNPQHLADNMRAGEGRLLNEKERKKLRALV